MPQLLINLRKLRHNLDFFRSYCSSRGLELAGVLKCAHAIPSLVDTFQSSGLAVLAFSRCSAVKNYAALLKERPLLIGIPAPDETESVVRYCSASFNSEMRTIQALSNSSKDSGCRHGIYLMIDIGDLREGIAPEKTVPFVREMLPFLNRSCFFIGLAANLGCASGTLPDEKNMRLLQELAEEIEKQNGLEVQKISIGGTIIYPWMLENTQSPRINQLRMGEGILCGHSPGYDIKLEGLYDDVFLFKAKVLEMHEKVSPPPGRRGLDAFGHSPNLGPPGLRKRALLDFGLVDTRREGLSPCLDSILLVTSNSEYTVADVTECPETIRAGDLLAFRPDYEAVTQACLSPFVQIIPFED